MNFFLEELERRGSPEGPLAGVELSQAVNEIARLATILNELATHYGDAFERRRRLENLRRSINESCRRRFEKGLTCELIEPLKALPEHIDPIVITAFEDTARNLRRLEFAVRQVGDTSRYDELLRNTTVIVREEIRSPALTLADRVRLIELLAGPRGSSRHDGRTLAALFYLTTRGCSSIYHLQPRVHRCLLLGSVPPLPR